MGRVSLGRVFVVLMLGVALGACTADEQGVELAADTALDQASSAAGQVLFEETCAGCHPRSGRGNYLKRIPMTLLTRRSEHELKDWIRGSGEHREMPNFDELNDSQLRDLAAYLKQEISRKTPLSQ